MKTLREKLAENAHISWAGWTQYIFNNCKETEKGELIIPAEKVKRWERQIKTAYDNLSELEKDSDRLEADAIINVLYELKILKK